MYINDKYYKVGFKTLWNRAPNMDSLIAVGSSAAVTYGVFAIYQMGYGLGHGDMDRVAHYHMDLYFESALTGESFPVDKGPGDKVAAWPLVRVLMGPSRARTLC